MDDPIVRLGEDGAVWQDRGPAGWYSTSGGWARDLAGLHEEYGQTRPVTLVPAAGCAEALRRIAFDVVGVSNPADVDDDERISFGAVRRALEGGGRRERS